MTEKQSEHTKEQPESDYALCRFCGASVPWYFEFCEPCVLGFAKTIRATEALAGVKE